MMEIGVIGAGNVGGTLGRRWAQAGHKVVFGVREPNDEKVRTLLAAAGANARAGRVEEATARNGRDALAQLQGQCYDVILSDLRMPALDGRAFYALLRQHSPALGARVIFLTGVSDEAETQAFLAQCGQPWLRKPYPIAALRSAIQQIVEGAVARHGRACTPCAEPAALEEVPGPAPAEASAV